MNSWYFRRDSFCALLSLTETTPPLCLFYGQFVLAYSSINIIPWTPDTSGKTASALHHLRQRQLGQGYRHAWQPRNRHQIFIEKSSGDDPDPVLFSPDPGPLCKNGYMMCFSSWTKHFNPNNKIQVLRKIFWYNS